MFYMNFDRFMKKQKTKSVVNLKLIANNSVI